MLNKEPDFLKLLEYNRNGLTEQVHYGIILYMNKNGIIKEIGENNDYKFYHRSCMKPLQASPLFDLRLDKKYNLTEKELAVCCASHCGDKFHQEIILSLLHKFGFKEDDLLCKPQMPLSKKEQEILIKEGKPLKKIHNNCSGKHSAMLAICKEMGFDTKTYKNMDNPLTDFITEKVCNLCNVSKNNTVLSKDGCGLPVIATTLKELGFGFLNLFTDKKYEKIKKAFLNNPYLIGGEERLDSEIINASDNLIAKVGACGLCVVVNIDSEECIVVKIADSNMEARSIVTINTLLQLKWTDLNKVQSARINNIYKKSIISQDNEIIGEITPCFSII
ncbi:MAG: asparaginase [Candidatus Gastranaerophilales bacterium]|nr:asparaginase [Candidatus Gastranaerophilales bacterium]